MSSRAPWTVLLAMALAACGGGGDGGPTAPAANRPPTVVARPESRGRSDRRSDHADVQRATSDPDGDAVTCTWDLGDGVPRTGASVARSYASAGSFPVNAACTDGRGGSATASGAATARTLDGAWLPLQNGVPGDRAQITQDGATLNGYADNSCCRHTFNAQVAHPRAVTFQFRFAGCKKNDTPMTGTVSADLNRIELTGTNCNVGQASFAFVRP